VRPYRHRRQRHRRHPLLALGLAKEAHKWAWWWGGNLGFIVGGAAVVIAALNGVHLLPARVPHTDAALIAAGLIAALAAQAVGYTFAWCGWWVARR